MCQTCHVICRKLIGSNQKDNAFITIMRVVVVGMNLSPLYTMNYEMNEWMPNKTDKRIAVWLFNIFVFINLWSYLTCSFVQPKEIPLKHMQDQTKMCLHCNNWKPERSHHCSMCNKCILKMDHHCPWIGNCVGYHNYKSFFLFCFFQMAMGMVYTWRWVAFMFVRPDDPQYDLSTFGLCCYYFTNTFSVIIAFALICHSANLFSHIWANVTTLEKMVGTKKRGIFCNSKEDQFAD